MQAIRRVNLNQLLDKSNLSLGVISDTHNKINDNLLHHLSECDVIIHAGDIGEANVLKQLRKYTPHVYPVRGNNDTESKWPLEDHSELDKIPEHLELTFNQQTVGLIHGHQYDPVRKRHDKLRKHFNNADIVIYGHSHRYVCDQEAKPWVINPGAGGYTRTFGGASIIILEYKNKAWKVTPHQLAEN